MWVLGVEGKPLMFPLRGVICSLSLPGTIRGLFMQRRNVDMSP